MTRVSILFCLAFLHFAMPVLAAGSADDRVAADALYTQAGELMKTNHFVEACPKLETSQRLDPGVGTLLRLGFCYEHLGRTASAVAAYNDAEALARTRTGDKRAEDAAARAKELEPKLSRLLITSTSPAPGQEVRRDGKLVDPGLLGTAVPVDPGERVIEASAPGRQPWKTSVHVDAAPGTTTIGVPMLAIAIDVPIVPARTAAPRPYWSGQRIAGVALGSVGIGGGIVGAVLGVTALSKNSSSKADCSPTDPNFCNTVGASLRSDAINFGNGSTAAIVIGGALLTTGVVLFATTPGTKLDTQIEVLPGAGSLAFRGRF